MCGASAGVLESCKRRQVGFASSEEHRCSSVGCQTREEMGSRGVQQKQAKADAWGPHSRTDPSGSPPRRPVNQGCSDGMRAHTVPLAPAGLGPRARGLPGSLGAAMARLRR